MLCKYFHGFAFRNIDDARKGRPSRIFYDGIEKLMDREIDSDKGYRVVVFLIKREY
jgi:hypothetical protein